jgi:hypothetical protein
VDPIPHIPVSRVSRENILIRIEESDRRPVPELDDERRRYYHMTAFGRRVAMAEAQRLADLVRAAMIADDLARAYLAPGRLHHIELNIPIERLIKCGRL